MNSMKRFFKDYYLFLAAAAVLLVLWEWLVRTDRVPSFILPAPTGILVSLFENKEVLLGHTWATFKEAILGFLIAAIAGVSLAVAMFFFKSVQKMVYPAVLISQTIPIIALSPIFVLWFGYSIWSKVAVTVLIAFFPIVVSTYDGLNHHDRDYVDLLRSMGARRWQVFKKVQLPMALPAFFSGIKLAAVFSVVGATIGEWLGASEGLGYYSRRMSGSLNAEGVFSAIFLLSLLGMCLFGAAALAEKQMFKWKANREDVQHEQMDKTK
ncbi:ABC transporter permease [Fictibacillus sp. WQ 8-8]|uniref:ABC transporter permease n=1 Tax=Fictibacillus sp. WQ 8-8 TaxID=2938788 RepID=UPI00210C1C38|nr:ABC transporter permease [Fictibacillus sp. WQ 8-8]MCQ6266883.1 ABC transporter permease [Fictibacillus sp. WQ 8-8]